MSAKEWRCFLGQKEIQFRRSIDSFQKSWHAKDFPEENYSTKISRGGSLIIGGGFLLSSGKLELQFVCGRQKAADYVKMLNDLSLAQEGRRLCGEEWIFQQGNSPIHDVSITKKYFLEQKIRLLDLSACSPDLQKICGDWLLQKFMKEVDSTQQFLDSKTQS